MNGGPNGLLSPVICEYEENYGNKRLRKVSDSEYQREVAVGKAPDTFPCGHILCHQCIRTHVKPRKDKILRCPLCGQQASRIHTADPGHSLGYNVSEVDTITLLSNYDDMLKKFNGISMNLRKIKEESVQSRSLGMTFTTCGCHMCHEQHGTLQVLQEFSELQVAHDRPKYLLPYFYKLCQGQVVTTFYSKVNSSSICVPCTYKSLRGNNDFPQLKLLSDNEAAHNPKAVLAEVGKIIAKNSAPIDMLHGKNVIDIDHKITLRERADEFDFDHTSAQIKTMVNDQERTMIKLATYRRLQDKGGLYHIQESSSVEQNLNETVIW